MIDADGRGDEGRADADDVRWTDVLVALDIGTSGARAAAFDFDGRRRLEIRRSYPTRSPHPGWAEQDPLAWRSATLGALRELVLRLGSRRRILAIGLTGQCPSVTLLDSAHRPVSAGLIYRDNRAVDEAAWMRERFGPVALHRRTGHLAAAFHVAPKLRWLQRNRPAEWSRGGAVVQPRDWLALTLTGELVTDGSHAAATLLYDLAARSWAADLIDELAIPAHWMPHLRPSAEVVGVVRPALAARLGLPGGVPVVLGGADSQACALGAGVIEPGPVSEMAGSSTCLNRVVAAPLANIDVTHYPHVVGNDLTTETGINTTGAAVAWIAGVAFGGRRGRAGSGGWRRLEAEVEAAPAGSDGVTVLPVLGDGERTDPGLRGAITGLSLRHGRGVLARATLEGVAFAIRDQLDLLAAGGARPTELRISGGDTRLAVWSQIKADVTGLPVRTVPGDAAVSGVSMLAGIGVGVYANAADAVERCVRASPVIEPDPSVRDVYDAAQGRYHELARSAAARVNVMVDESEVAR